MPCDVFFSTSSFFCVFSLDVWHRSIGIVPYAILRKSFQIFANSLKFYSTRKWFDGFSRKKRGVSSYIKRCSRVDLTVCFIIYANFGFFFFFFLSGIQTNAWHWNELHYFICSVRDCNWQFKHMNMCKKTRAINPSINRHIKWNVIIWNYKSIYVDWDCDLLSRINSTGLIKMVETLFKFYWNANVYQTGWQMK